MNSKSAEMKSKVDFTFHFVFIFVLVSFSFFFGFATSRRFAFFFDNFVYFIFSFFRILCAVYVFVFLARKTCDLNIELILFNNLHFSISSPVPPAPSALRSAPLLFTSPICIFCYSFALAATGSTRLVLARWLPRSRRDFLCLN